MDKHRLWLILLVGAGLLALIIGTLDPLEGGFIILFGSGLTALGAFLSKSPYRRFIYWAFGLTALGMAVVMIWSYFGGVGGDTGRSTWWLLTALSYPVGWVMSLVGTVRLLIKPFRRPS